MKKHPLSIDYIQDKLYYIVQLTSNKKLCIILSINNVPNKQIINKKGKSVLIMKKHIFSVTLIFCLIFVLSLDYKTSARAASTSLKLNRTTLTIKIGNKKCIKVKGKRKKLSFKSSNIKVATVSPKGIVKGIKKGITKITVKAGKLQTKCKVIVIGKKDYSPVLTEKKIRKSLCIPKKAQITIKYGKTFYKESFGATLIPVEVYEHGTLVAGASFFVKNGDLGCNVGQYGTYS